MAFENRTLRNLRNLGHQKAARMVTGNGIPDDRDGNEGEFRLHSTVNGIRLYVKHGTKWIGFAPETEIEDIIDLDDDLSVADTGSVTLTSGLILQWGNFDVPAATTKAVVFPLIYPHKCISVWFTMYDGGDTDGIANVVAISAGPTDTGFTASLKASEGDTVYWLALGN